MNKYDLMKLNDSVIRIIDIKADKLLITDCIKRTMPVWVKISDIKEYRECSVTELQDIQPVETLNTEQKKIIHERFTMITPILANIGKKQERSELIRDISEDNGITKQTVRKYLCAYLAYMDITALVPKERVYDDALTQDEKNIRWALNKFYYTTQKLDFDDLARYIAKGSGSSLRQVYDYLENEEMYLSETGISGYGKPDFVNGTEDPENAPCVESENIYRYVSEHTDLPMELIEKFGELEELYYTENGIAE